MTDWLPIRYREFWDVPRIFLVSYHDQLYLFDCSFDDATEDFLSSYRVYMMPALNDEEVAGPWSDLPARALKHVGDVAVEQIRFDATRRQAVDASVFGHLSTSAKANGLPATTRVITGS